MIRILLSCIAILSTIFYCVWEKNKTYTIMKENCIEIYFYKEPILPENCVWYRDSKYYKNERFDFNKEYGIVDTIKNRISHGAYFKNNLSKIESKPFINNNEISLINNLKTSFVINKIIKIQNTNYYRRLFNLKQFVLLLNKKPILNGYFICSTASTVCENTRILIYDPELYKNKLLLWNFKDRKITDINLKKDYPELYQAFKNTNRLIE